MSVAESFYIPRKVWTRAEVESLPSNGSLSSLELVNGELLDKRMGKKPPHIFWIGVIGKWLRQLFGDDFVRSEGPINVAFQDNPTSEPEPDLAVTVRSRGELRYVKVDPKDLRLVVEISDSTYDYDRTVKAALYARAEIVEYWVVDIREEDAPRLIRHLDPRDGRYQSVDTFDYNYNLVFEDRSFSLSDLG